MKLLVAGILTLLLAATESLAKKEKVPESEHIPCPDPPEPTNKAARADVYRNQPFQAGELIEYGVYYAGVLVGYGTLSVKPPTMFQGAWHRQFHVHGRTGDWYKAIFAAEDVIQAISRPWDFGIAKFYIEQNEAKMFGRHFVQKKWLEFDNRACKVRERVWTPDKPEKTGEFELSYAAIDALGAVYKLRTLTYEIGQKQRFIVYTSEKNWWLEAEPLAVETVKVAAGEFTATKLKLLTYLGKALQQKGDVFIWIDRNSPHHPMVQLKGEIKIGSVWMEMSKFSPGRGAG
jgi:hypothetical protein